MTTTTRAEWLVDEERGPGSPERPLLTWVGGPPAATSAVVIAGPIGYEYWPSHRTLRALGERLSSRGHRVVRFDYDGTGDSSGERWDGGRVYAWRASLSAAVAGCRRAGAERVTIVGLRLGATFALIDGAALDAEAIVAWVPVISGKRFVREIRMLALPLPEGDAVTFAGVGFDSETVAALAPLDAGKLLAQPAARVLVMAQPEQPCDNLVGALGALGVEVTSEAMAGAATMLSVPAEDATVPVPIIDRIAEWIGDANPQSAGATDDATTSMASGPVSTAITWRGATLTEDVDVVAGLVAITTRGATTNGTTVVLLNSGSEPHIGPGRAWVEYARGLAALGFTAIRVDWSGWGESDDRAHAPGRPYDAHCIDETIAIVDELRRRTPDAEIALLGLCAGAWAALRVAQVAAVDVVAAINPQLYWEPGDPVEALLTDTRKRRIASGEIARFGEGAASGRWTAEDRAGDRPMASRWLDALGARGVEVLMLFAKDDDGIEYLRDRCGHRVTESIAAGWLRVVEIDDIDHNMFREWRRPEVVDTLAAFLGARRPGR